MGIGNRVLEKRKTLSLSQEALGQRSGVTASYISQIEAGSKTPSYASLIRIAGALGISADYLMGGEATHLDDDASKIIASSLQLLDQRQKEDVLDHIHHIFGIGSRIRVPFFDNPGAYADYLVNQYALKLPIDPFALASTLGMNVFSAKNCEHEGVLYKGTSQPVAVLADDITDLHRRKFTIAILIGHLVIPWHLRGSFERLRRRTSLEATDPLDIQALQFASELLIPSKLLRGDSRRLKAGLRELEHLAYDKYDVSLTAMLHKVVEMQGSSRAMVTSIHGRITRPYIAGLPFELKQEVQSGSVAADLLKNPPKEKDIRDGFVDPATWVINPPRGLKVFEESLVDPKQGVIVTLLRFSGSTRTSTRADVASLPSDT